MSISLTEKAASHIRTHLEKRGGGLGLRLGIKRSGCSGWSYDLGFADEIGGEDLIFDSRDIRIVVPKDALPLVDGTEVDYVSEGLNQMFRFNNPNVADECGCGESFTV